jgi:phosphatidylethanolamine/phosphatidyl-N-methylethanolamine N-methyltransferase
VTDTRTFPLEDEFRFLRRLITTPRGIGAIAPSGPMLARAMAAQADTGVHGPVLELGPGTGVFTGAMIARGIAPECITTIEFDPVFASLVASRFPRVRVINGDAFDLSATLGADRRGPFVAALSGIPLLNFPEGARTRLVEAVLDRLAPGAPFAQFSYGLHSPVAPPPGATVTQAAFVLWNVPPARVWVYRRG